MPTITLTASGAVANNGLHANVTINGSSPQWGDGSDGTNAILDSAGSGFNANASAPLDPLTLPAGATVTGIRATVRAGSDGAFAQFTLAEGPLLSDFACYFTKDLADLSDNGTAISGAGATDYAVVVATGAEIDADPLTTLLGTPYVAASTSGLETLTVYGFTVFVDYTTPDDSEGIPPVTDPPPYGPGSEPPPDNGGPLPPRDPRLSSGGGYMLPGLRRQSPTRAEVVIDGHWLTSVCPWGDLTWSHVWPGGSGNASWTAEKVPARLRKRGLLVRLFMGAECFWSGPMTEPDPTGATMTAAGLWTIGTEWTALDGSDNTSVVPDEAIDAAISRGMPWKRRDSISTSAVDIDTTQGPVTIGALLDAYALAATQRWGVTPDGYVVSREDPVDPKWHVQPLDGDLTPSDDFATRLIGRYYTGSGYDTATVTDDPGNNGIREATVDLTPLGTLTLTKAQNRLQSLLDLGMSRPAWANPIVVGYRDIVSAGQVSVGLERPVAGDVARVHGHVDETQTRGGRMWTDVLLGQTDVASEQLTLTPMGMPALTLLDVIALAAQSKKRSA